MKHKLTMEGYGYRLRPITLEDAPFIIESRLEDMQRNRFIHAISSDIREQEKWLENYFAREGDYYFVIENRFTRQPEGLIAFYNEQDGRAEWGRWVVKKGSLAAVESVWLLYRIAFELVGLQELYCRTVKDNIDVVSFHDSIGEINRCIYEGFFEINGSLYDAVEHYCDRMHFTQNLSSALESKSSAIAQRNFRQLVGRFEFHHIAVATKGIQKELPSYALLGYKQESPYFTDTNQGIKGIFLAAKNQPRLELLENLPGSNTLDPYIEKNLKMYHSAYLVEHIEKAVEVLINCRAKIISPLKESTYFGKRICFLVLPNLMMIELIEE